MKKIYLSVTFLAICSMVCFGQGSVSHTVRIIAHPILELKFDDSINKAEFNFTSISDYDNGKTNFEAVGLKVNSNKKWVISVKSSSPTFLSENLTNTEILSKSLLVRKTGAQEVVAIETFEQTIASGNSGGFDKNKVILDYIANPGYIKPDTYTLEVTYTLTTP
ncbi:MAG: hypothetical protein KA313_11365 [Pseudarcicella sp.]|nr:hypothetical protein [Pseudarcicella sp.]